MKYKTKIPTNEKIFPAYLEFIGIWDHPFIVSMQNFLKNYYFLPLDSDMCKLGGKNVRFAKNFTYVLKTWSLSAPSK